MGLTIHYELMCKGRASSAGKLITALHQAAHDLPFKEVGSIVDLKGGACEFEKRDRDDPLRWLLCQAVGNHKLNEESWLNVPPTQVIAFSAWPGEGCESAEFGLCQYPAAIDHRSRRIRTKLPGWRWSSFCKTQYASDPGLGGVQNFLRCHLAVIALLDKARELGCLREVRDEGKFWESRDVEALVREIGTWNQFIAAFGGRIKDAVGDGVEMPIAEYPNFELLELAGQKHLPPETEQLLKLIKQVSQKR